jgi:peptidyl-prolyl cis-trans isomerase C
VSIRVNGREIDEAAIAAELQYHPAASLEEARRLASEALVLRELLAQRAEREGLALEGDGIERLLDTLVEPASPDAAALRAYYDAHPEKFRSPDLLEARHILCAAPEDDAEARAAAYEKATRLAAELVADRGRFGALAREHSDCPSKSADGHLGQIQRGSTVPELETYLFSLDPGELCPSPVASRYGWHVIELLAREPGRQLPFEYVEPKIAEFLAARAWREGFRAAVLALAREADIEGFAFDGEAAQAA